MYTMIPERTKMEPKTHIRRARPMLWVFGKTTDAAVKTPEPI
jgi:hypothetical protein